MALVTLSVSALVLGAYHGARPRHAGDSQVWLQSGYVPDAETLLLGSRPFFVPLVHRLLAFDQEIVCWVQAAVQLLCWAWFARELSLFVRRRAARVAAFSSVLCWLALDANDWAFTVRSESFSNALLFAFLAGLLGFVRADSAGRTRAAYGWILLLAPLSFAFAGTRDAVAYLMVGAGLTAPVAAIVGKRTGRRLMASLVLGVTLLSVGVVSEHLTEQAGRHRLPLVNVVLRRVLTEPHKLAYFRDELGLPVTPELLKRRNTSFSTDQWTVVRHPRFAKFMRWVDEEGHDQYKKYLASHLALTVREAYPWFERYAGADYRKSYLVEPRTPLLKELRRARLRVDPLGVYPKTTWLFLACGAVVAPVAAPRRAVRALSVVLGFCCVSAVVLTYVCFHGDAMEMLRHGAIVSVLLQAAACLGLTLAALGLGRLWARRRGGLRVRAAGAATFGRRSHSSLRAWRAGVWAGSLLVFAGVAFAAAAPRVRPNWAPRATLTANPPERSLDVLVDGDFQGERVCLPRDAELVVTLSPQARASAAYVFHGTNDARETAYLLTAEQKRAPPRTLRVGPGVHWVTPFQGNRNLRRLVVKNLGDELCITEVTVY